MVHRWGEAEGDATYDEIEQRLLEPAPVLRPTPVVHGGENADNLPETTEGKDDLFAAGYERMVLDGAGHVPPRAAPNRVAEAILAGRPLIAR